MTILSGLLEAAVMKALISSSVAFSPGASTTSPEVSPSASSFDGTLVLAERPQPDSTNSMANRAHNNFFAFFMFFSPFPCLFNLTLRPGRDASYNLQLPAPS